MKKKSNLLLTFALAGTMLLGATGIAMAAPAATDTADSAAVISNSAPVSTDNQNVAPGNQEKQQTPAKPDQNEVKKPVPPAKTQNNQNKIKEPAPSVQISFITFEQLSSILDRLVDKDIITYDQEDAILSDLTVTGRITKYQIYNRLSELVADGALSNAERTVIMSSLPC